MKFKLEITLGNDAMSSPEDVADALQRAATRITDYQTLAGTIMDANGNDVGNWRTTGR